MLADFYISRLENETKNLLGLILEKVENFRNKSKKVYSRSNSPRISQEYSKILSIED